MDKGNSDIPAPVAQLIRDCEGALGDRLVGVIIVRPLTSGMATSGSDLMLSVIVSDIDAERTHQEVLRLVEINGVDFKTASISIETYMRVKGFLNLGDPSAWIVCTVGTILKDRSQLLSELQLTCKASLMERESDSVSGYLRSKCRNHHDLAMQGFHQFLSNIHVSVMAGAQAVAVEQSAGTVRPKELIALAEWKNMERALTKASATPTEIRVVERLITAHKQMRLKHPDFAGKELMDMVRSVGELWNKLLPKELGADD